MNTYSPPYTFFFDKQYSSRNFCVRKFYWTKLWHNMFFRIFIIYYCTKQPNNFTMKRKCLCCSNVTQCKCDWEWCCIKVKVLFGNFSMTSWFLLYQANNNAIFVAYMNWIYVYTSYFYVFSMYHYMWLN